MYVWKWFHSLLLSIASERLMSLLVRTRNRSISQVYDVNVNIYDTKSLMQFLCVFVSTMLNDLMLNIVYRSFAMPELSTRIALFAAHDRNFLNQMNDNRNKIDMLCYCYFKQSWVQIFIIWWMQSTQNVQSKGERRKYQQANELCFCCWRIVWRCIRMKLTSHSSNRAIHYFVAFKCVAFLSTFYVVRRYINILLH